MYTFAITCKYSFILVGAPCIFAICVTLADYVMTSLNITQPIQQDDTRKVLYTLTVYLRLCLRYVCNTALLITCCRSDWVDFGEVIIRMKLVFIGEESLNVFLF